jgi:hypothetical protein
VRGAPGASTLEPALGFEPSQAPPFASLRTDAQQPRERDGDEEQGKEGVHVPVTPGCVANPSVGLPGFTAYPSPGGAAGG